MPSFSLNFPYLWHFCLAGGDHFAELQEQTGQPDYDFSLVTGMLRRIGVEQKSENLGSESALVTKDGTVSIPHLHTGAAGNGSWICHITVTFVFSSENVQCSTSRLAIGYDRNLRAGKTKFGWWQYSGCCNKHLAVLCMWTKMARNGINFSFKLFLLVP